MQRPASEYDLTFGDRGEYLLATLRAVSVRSEMAPDILREIRTEMMGARTGRLLLRTEIAHTPSEADTLKIMNEVLRALPGMKIAFVNEDPNHSEVLRLAAALGSQSGEEHRSFSNVAAAEKWLLES